MAAIAACSRARQLGAHSIAFNGLSLKVSFSFERAAPSAFVEFSRQNSQLVNPTEKWSFLLDTSAIGNYFSLQQHETTKLHNDIEKMRCELEKMRNELRYEIDKHTVGQRLDLNLEKGRIREELFKNLTNKLDRETHIIDRLEAARSDVIVSAISEKLANHTLTLSREIYALKAQHIHDIHALRAQLEAAKYDVTTQLKAAKYDVIKYGIGTLLPIFATSIGALEVNFIEPAHDKQDFEGSTPFIRLETRLKQMTIEYWL